MSIQIEQLKEGDGERLKTLRIEALKSDPDAFGTTVDKVLTFPMETWEEQISTLPTFVVVKDSKDRGMVRMAHDKDNPKSSCWLISMWVAKDLRGTGASKLLVDELITHAKSLSLKEMFLDVANFNISASRFYEKCGFVATGIQGTLPEPRTYITESQMKLVL